MKVQTAERLSAEAIEKLQKEFMGKRIQFQTILGIKWIGTCQFLGYNPHLPSWKLQITIDRTPVQHVNHKTIKLYE